MSIILSFVANEWVTKIIWYSSFFSIFSFNRWMHFNIIDKVFPVPAAPSNLSAPLIGDVTNDFWFSVK